MEQNKYVEMILKNLVCNKEKKIEIEKELNADIAGALEQGETWEEIQERLGTPLMVAQEFNENLEPVKKMKTSVIAGIIGGVLLVVAILALIVWNPLATKKDNQTNATKAALTLPVNEEEVAKRAEQIVTLFSAKLFDDIYKQENKTMQNQLTTENLKEVFRQYVETAGKLNITSSSAVTSAKESGKKYMICQIQAKYDNKKIIYTLSFDEDMKLAGFYLR